MHTVVYTHIPTQTHTHTELGRGRGRGTEKGKAGADLNLLNTELVKRYPCEEITTTDTGLFAQ